MAVGVERRDSVYWAGRTTLVRRPEDTDTYDRAFRAWWEHEHDLELVPPPVTRELSIAFDAEADDDDAPEAGDTATHADASRCATAPPKCCATATSRSYTPDEFAEARRLMADLRFAGSLRRSRRQQRSRRHRGKPDLRRTVRRALRTGGEPVHRAFLESASRPRRIVLLCDVSGSMEPYAVRSCASCTPRSSAAAGSRRSRWAPGSPASPASSRRAIPTPPSPPPPTGWSTGRAAPVSARRSASSTTGGACGAWPGARSS